MSHYKLFEKVMSHIFMFRSKYSSHLMLLHRYILSMNFSRLSFAREAHAWLKSNPLVVEHESIEIVTVLTTSSRTSEGLFDRSLKKLVSTDRFTKWKSLKYYVRWAISLHRITMQQSSHAPEYLCTCSDFLKNYTCKHIFGVAHLKDMFIFPKESLTGGLGPRQPVGRPKNYAKALKTMQ